MLKAGGSMKLKTVCVMSILSLSGCFIFANNAREINLPEGNRRLTFPPLEQMHGRGHNAIEREVDYDVIPKFTAREKKEVSLTDAQKEEIRARLLTLDDNSPEKRKVAESWLEEKIDDPKQVDGILQSIQEYSKKNKPSLHLANALSALEKRALQPLSWEQTKFFLNKSIADSAEAKVLGEAAAKMLSNLSDAERDRLSKVIQESLKLKKNLFVAGFLVGKANEISKEWRALLKVAAKGMEVPESDQNNSKKKLKSFSDTFPVNFTKDGKTYELSLGLGPSGLELRPRDPSSWGKWSLDPSRALPLGTRVADTNVVSHSLEAAKGIVILGIDPMRDYYEPRFKRVYYSEDIIARGPSATFRDKTGVTEYLADKFYDTDDFELIEFSNRTKRKYLSVTGK